MKRIRKGGVPHSYAAWCKKVTGTMKADYREIPKRLKKELLSGLLREQGWICAYTMKRLDEDNSHVEHIKPECCCRDDEQGSDMDYGNMVACFPRDGMPRRYRYGAQEKDNWWKDDGRDFISPLHENCERRFQFDLSGDIKAVGGNRAAANTINVLGLKHVTLIEERRRVIHEFVYGPTKDNPLSGTQAARAIANICARNGNGSFYEFCVAIRDALAEHANALGKEARRRRFSRKRMV